MSDVLIPKAYKRCVVAEDHKGFWNTEIFVQREPRRYFIKINRVGSDAQVIGPLKQEDLTALEKALQDIKWAARNGFAATIPDDA